MKKIVIIGPESTGKSTLCEQLAKHFSTLWCPEYAREYLLKHGMDYTYDDLLTVAKGQVDLEEKFIDAVQMTRQSEGGSDSHSGVHSAKLLFIDTDMYVMKVWCEFVFGNCHQFILQQIVERKYDLYLFCNVDLPWVKDELREYPDLETRNRLYFIYKDIMINQSVKWVDISGGYEERLKRAVEAVDELLESA